MAIKIRSDSILKGYKFGKSKKDIKIAQYADDAILFLNNGAEIEHSFKIIENFSKVSGLQLNKSKCEGFWLGNQSHLQDNCTLYGIKWPIQFRYLGIYLGYNKSENYKLNWELKITKIEELLNGWLKRDLSLLGKIQIIKSCAIPQITLAATILPIPSNIISDINRLVFRFL